MEFYGTTRRLSSRPSSWRQSSCRAGRNSATTLLAIGSRLYSGEGPCVQLAGAVIQENEGFRWRRFDGIARTEGCERYYGGDEQL